METSGRVAVFARQLSALTINPFFWQQQVQVLGKPAKYIQYPSQQEALSFLERVLADRRGVGVLHGGKASGKSQFVVQVAQKLQQRSAVALVDGARMRPSQFLGSILTQFGYPVELNSVDELLNMLSVFAVQQTRSYKAPVLILENVNHMYPATLCVLCKLAELAVRDRYALRIILVADRQARQVIDAPSMKPVADRIVGEYDLRPLTVRESQVFLFDKLRVLGMESAESAFAYDICDELHAVTDGWPGRLDSVALAVADHGGPYPVRLEDIDHPDVRRYYDLDDVPVLEAVPEEEQPGLIISRHGEVVGEFELTDGRTILGRSDVSDIVLDDRFVSKHHALIVRTESSLMLVDLKSRNGTLVNSMPIKSRYLRNNDIVSIGDYRLKVLCPQRFSAADQATEIADTAKMKNLDDARRARKARLLSVASRRRSPL